MNVRSGTAMDLSGDDNKTLIGYTPTGNNNQQVGAFKIAIAVLTDVWAVTVRVYSRRARLLDPLPSAVDPGSRALPHDRGRSAGQRCHCREHVPGQLEGGAEG